MAGRRVDVQDPVACLATLPSVRLDPQARREAALVLAGRALEQDDPREWLTDVLGYFGLLDRSLKQAAVSWPWLSERDQAVLAAWLAEQPEVAA